MSQQFDLRSSILDLRIFSHIPIPKRIFFFLERPDTKRTFTEPTSWRSTALSATGSRPPRPGGVVAAGTPGTRSTRRAGARTAARSGARPSARPVTDGRPTTTGTTTCRPSTPFSTNTRPPPTSNRNTLPLSLSPFLPLVLPLVFLWLKWVVPAVLVYWVVARPTTPGCGRAVPPLSLDIPPRRRSPPSTVGCSGVLIIP